MLGSAESQVRKLIIREIIFEEFQRVFHSITVINVTDRRTDRWTPYHDGTALCYASSDKNLESRLEVIQCNTNSNINRYIVMTFIGAHMPTYSGGRGGVGLRGCWLARRLCSESTLGLLLGWMTVCACGQVNRRGMFLRWRPGGTLTFALFECFFLVIIVFHPFGHVNCRYK